MEGRPRQAQRRAGRRDPEARPDVAYHSITTPRSETVCPVAQRLFLKLYERLGAFGVRQEPRILTLELGHALRVRIDALWLTPALRRAHQLTAIARPSPGDQAGRVQALSAQERPQLAGLRAGVGLSNDFRLYSAVNRRRCAVAATCTSCLPFAPLETVFRGHVQSPPTSTISEGATVSSTLAQWAAIGAGEALGEADEGRGPLGSLRQPGPAGLNFGQWDEVRWRRRLAGGLHGRRLRWKPDRREDLPILYFRFLRRRLAKARRQVVVPLTVNVMGGTLASWYVAKNSRDTP